MKISDLIQQLQAVVDQDGEVCIHLPPLLRAPTYREVAIRVTEEVEYGIILMPDFHNNPKVGKPPRPEVKRQPPARQATERADRNKKRMSERHHLGDHSSSPRRTCPLCPAVTGKSRKSPTLDPIPLSR